MPQSDYWAVPYVLEAAVAIDPVSVLDIGVGMGQYGLHLRQSFDIARGRLTKPEWTMKIDGVELFEPYRNPLWDYYYDTVTIADARTHIATLTQQYDLLLMCDVIEHFDKAEAMTLLTAARKAASWIIVTTPRGDYPQGAMYGNDAETHRSAWTPAEFQSLGAFTHEIKDTFLALVPGVGIMKPKLKPGDLPTLFTHSAGSLAKCFRLWLPQMVKSKLGR
ncbi:hypothetical protein BH11PLA2_BH11PLA2_12060 [soil metagenome]